jgi:hypothetical protein
MLIISNLQQLEDLMTRIKNLNIDRYLVFEEVSNGIDCRFRICERDYEIVADEYQECYEIILRFTELTEVVSESNETYEVTNIKKLIEADANLCHYNTSVLADPLGVVLEIYHENTNRWHNIKLLSKKIIIVNEGKSQFKVKPYLSEDVLSIVIDKDKLPTALSLKSFVSRRNQKVEFKEYWGTNIPVKTINSNLNGLSIVDVNRTKYGLGIRFKIDKSYEALLQNSILKNPVILTMIQLVDDNTIWDILRKEYIPKLSFEKLVCGNVCYSKKEYENLLKTGEIDSLEKIITYET